MQTDKMARSLLFAVLMCCGATLISCTSTAGFRMKLTHVDAKRSYTTAERLQRTIAGSRRRLASIQAASPNVSAPVHWDTNQYIAEYLIGSPPQLAEALIDTGSDLIWTQCSTCPQETCEKQDLPLYNLSRSDSFQPVPCNDTMCLANDIHSCAADGSCNFLARYGAGNASGSIGTEIFNFQNGTARLSFGCADKLAIREGSLDGASGLIGLGRGPLSLVSQTGATKFSYCHTSYFNNSTVPSHLFVGDSASLSGGSPVMSMPFVKAPEIFPFNIFYYVPLVGITVGQTRLSFPATVFDLLQNGTGGVIVDSGSPYTVLVGGAYLPLRDEFERQLNGTLVPPPAAAGSVDLCVPQDAVKNVVPSIVFHFSGGADMVVPPETYWALLDNSTSCMMMFMSSHISIIGNSQLQNKHLLYDLANDELFFQTADCSSL